MKIRASGKKAAKARRRAKIAPEAPTTGIIPCPVARVDEDGGDPGADAADEVVEEELGAPHALLELDPEEEQGEHVEEDVRPSRRARTCR